MRREKITVIEVAYNARCGVARRIALVRLNDPELNRIFAQSDPDPMVRRRLVRELTDTETLCSIMKADDDRSVRGTAERQYDALRKAQSEPGR